MSLFIIGSANRVTANIVLQLARNGQYSSVTIGDLLPAYEHHHRFYRIQKQLDQLQLPMTVKLAKLATISDLYQHNSHSDVLFVTHDYYQHVTSKTKLMALTAQACKKRDHVFFATPVEYDHYGFENPDHHYRQAETKVREDLPQATIIRSDVQDAGEAFAYINSKKNLIDQKVYDFYANSNFSPKVVNANHYANVVCNAIRDRLQGKSLLVQGDSPKSSFEVPFNADVDPLEYWHARCNIAEMTSKYNGLVGEGCERVEMQQ